jgi:hypothetical protein
MLIRCPECGKRISDKVEACPKCGMPNPAAALAARRLEEHQDARAVWHRLAVVVPIALVCLGIIVAATRFRWPIRYVAGGVSGTSAVTQEQFALSVEDAVKTWNTAAGRMVFTKAPFGRTVAILLKVDAGQEDYLTVRGQTESKIQDAQDNVAACQREQDALTAWDRENPVHDAQSMIDSITKMDGIPMRLQDAQAALQNLQQELYEVDNAHTEGRLPGNKDDYIKTAPAVGSVPSTITITAYLNDKQLQVLLLHAPGHTLGLKDSDRYDVMFPPLSGMYDMIDQTTTWDLAGWWN